MFCSDSKDHLYYHDGTLKRKVGYKAEVDAVNACYRLLDKLSSKKRVGYYYCKHCDKFYITRNPKERRAKKITRASYTEHQLKYYFNLLYDKDKHESI